MAPPLIGDDHDILLARLARPDFHLNFVSIDWCYPREEVAIGTPRLPKFHLDPLFHGDKQVVMASIYHYPEILYQCSPHTHLLDSDDVFDAYMGLSHFCALPTHFGSRNKGCYVLHVIPDGCVFDNVDCALA